MPEIKFTGVTYDYNNVTINIAEGDISASALALSGVTIGTAADYDRIANLIPAVMKVRDDVSSVSYFGLPLVGASAITMAATSTTNVRKTYTLKKKGNKLNCKVTGS